MSDLAVLIREVTPDDAADLQARCLPRNTVAEVQAQIREYQAQAAAGEQLYLVAEWEGHAIGQAILIRNPFGLERHRAGVYGLVVWQPYWRRGVARQLIAACCARAKGLGIEILEIGVRGGEPAERVYRRLGFIEWARLPRGLKEPWGEQRVYEDVRLYLPLK